MSAPVRPAASRSRSDRLTPVRRAELQSAGIQVPALPTVALGALPGPPDWAARLARLGLDVVASGAAIDTEETVAAARAAAPYRPLKAMAGDAARLAAAGCRLIEGPGAMPDGVYGLSAVDGVVAAVDGSSADVEDLNDIARAALRAARGLGAANVWVAATAGLDSLAEDVVEAKLRALVEGANQARLAIAKDQFDLAPAAGRGPSS